MDTKHLLAQELHSLTDPMMSIDIDAEVLPKIRATSADRNVLGDPDRVGVIRTEVQIPAYDSADSSEMVRCLLYRPVNEMRDMPAYLHIHGGGYIMGAPEGSDVANLMICSKLNVVILSVDYRLAPEHPIPTPLNDCYAGLVWIHQNASELGVDATRVAVGGESAGGGLAAAVAIKARDHGQYPLCHQHLTYPMLDNLTGAEGVETDPLVGEFVWTRQRNQYAWGVYLGDAQATAPQVPARVEEYAGLPPTWMFTAGLDLFRDENIRYAQALMQAGVPVDLQVYAQACHGFQLVPGGTELGARFTQDHIQALARGLKLQT